MRGPEDVSVVHPTSTNGEANATEPERDPCSSPPCKRLKQAVLSFQSESPSAISEKTENPQVINGLQSSTSANDVVIIEEELPNGGGLVTPALSPDKGTRPGSSASICSLDTSSISSSPTPSSAGEKNGDAAPGLSSPTDRNGSNMSKTPSRPSSAEKVKKKEERERLKAEKQRQKEEKERQRLEAKVAKEKEKLEAKQKREQERLEKQTEKEKKEKEKLEKKQKEDKERQEKKEKKEEERKKKEDEINAKLDEKRKKEEEKRQQEEEQLRKKQQARQNFASFFIPTNTPIPKTLPKAIDRFPPFQIKKFMTLAPSYRTLLTEQAKYMLDKNITIEDEACPTYLQDLQKRKPLPRYVKARRRNRNQEEPANVKDEPMEDDEDKKEETDVISIPDEENSSSSSVMEIEQPADKKRMKAILLQFKENYRPAYYGTQSKKSKMISPRNPFKKDKDVLDYDVDSADEWEEEEPGESLSDSEGEDEDDEGDEDDDGGFFVPHGYLSDDEGIQDGEENPGEKKEEQIAKVKAWEAGLKKKFKPLRPICVGCLWGADAEASDILKQFEAISLTYEPAVTNAIAVSESSEQSREAVSFRRQMYVPEEALPDLIQFVHGSTSGLMKIMKQFRDHWSRKCQGTDSHSIPAGLEGKGHISKRQLERKIQGIAVKERRMDKFRWYVHNNILEKYGFQGFVVTANMLPASEVTVEGKTSPPKPGIQNFTRPVSPFVAISRNDEFKRGVLRPENPQSLSTFIERSPDQTRNAPPQQCLTSSQGIEDKAGHFKHLATQQTGPCQSLGVATIVVEDKTSPPKQIQVIKRRITPTLITGPATGTTVLQGTVASDKSTSDKKSHPDLQKSIDAMMDLVKRIDGSQQVSGKRPAPSPEADKRAAKVPRKSNSLTVMNCSTNTSFAQIVKASPSRANSGENAVSNNGSEEALTIRAGELRVVNNAGDSARSQGHKAMEVDVIAAPQSTSVQSLPPTAIMDIHPSSEACTSNEKNSNCLNITSMSVSSQPQNDIKINDLDRIQAGQVPITASVTC